MTEDTTFKVNDKRGADKEKKEEAPSTPEPQTPPSDVSNQELPEASFVNFVASLGTSCMMHLGLIENPHTKTKEVSLGMAQHEIELLTMIQEKTKGNLQEPEEKLITQLLYELRMSFVQAGKADS